MKDDAQKGDNEQQEIDSVEAEPRPDNTDAPVTDESLELETEAADEVEQDLDRLLDDTRRQRDEYLDLAQRTKADFENYRRRVTLDAASAVERGKDQLIVELLPVLDNLERALEAAKPFKPEVSEGRLSEGVRLVYEELKGVVKRAGVESIEPDGEQFDPNLHEAVMTKTEEGIDAGTVVEVVQKGYRREQKIVRPAKVVVAE